jgi:hypothetical protein
MDRRDFLKIASCAGLSVAAPTAFAGRGLSTGGRPQQDEYNGNLYMLFHAGGGWDPTHLCDPKPASGPNDPDPMNHFYEVAQFGNISCPAEFPEEDYNGAGGLIPQFFEAWYDRLLVVNGIDMQTNSHDAGTRHMWSARLNEGYPSIGAFLAGAFDPSLPLSYLVFGGYSVTAGLVARTRAGNLNALARLAYPDRINPDDAESNYFTEPAAELIDEALWHRDQALMAGQGLPRIRQSINTLFTARSGSNELKLLQEYLPEELSGNALERQAQLAIAAYKAGICISANLSTGGFDTHGNHDAGQIPRLETMLNGMDFAMREAERQGVADKVVLAAGSDFGRTPGYNNGNGKDHWSITSMMFMGAGIQGNRVIGETTDRHRAYGVNPDLSVDYSDDARRIEPKDVHWSLRNMAGLADGELASMFPLSVGDPIDIFA